MSKTYFIYILASKSRVLYTGMTNNLARRIIEHKNKLVLGFTSKYNVNRLVYYEEYGSPQEAILREKQIKGWLRIKKIKLIEDMNPGWKDLSEGWFDDEDILHRDSSLRSE
ncbi:MAG: endonuclease [Anaerolinea sp.]|nr:endonuclease [Anaerolinea sp.]